MEGPQARLFFEEESLKDRSQEVGVGPREAQWMSRTVPEMRRLRSVEGISWLRQDQYMHLSLRIFCFKLGTSWTRWGLIE